MASQQQPFWSESDQRWLSVTFDTKYQRSYSKYWDVTSNQWAFFRWVGPESTSGPTEYHREEGPRVHGTCNPSNPIHGTHYERLDPSYYVRHKDFFQAGKVFSVLFAQSAGDTAMTNYNHDAITTGRYGETVHAQIRRFIVVQQKREFCFAVPIFTYGNRGTTKSGVVPSEHAIAYSYGHQPTLLPGEEELQKDPICIVSTDSVPLSISSRIYFGIHHPIQYNVKVKELGYVLPDDLIKLTSYWAMEHMKLEDEENDVYKERDTGVFTQTQNSALTYYQHEDTKSNNHFEPVKNPRAFFKKGRVFESSQWGSQFSAVVKPMPTHAVCLPIAQRGYTYSSREHADIVFTTEAYTQQEVDDHSPNRAIYVKKENDNVTIQSEMCMEFAKPHTIEYGTQVRNVGRVFGNSIGYMEKRFAESLGLGRP